MRRVARVVLVVQGLRAFTYGFGAVLIGSVLAGSGLSDAAAGGVFTAMLAGMAGSSYLLGRFGDRLDPRLAYRTLLALMGACGAVFALTSWLPALLLAAATGTLSASANESGPITSLEQAMLAQAPSRARTGLYGRYNAVAYLAGSFGALAAGLPAALRHLDPALPSDRWWLLLFPLMSVACVAAAGGLPAPPPRATQPEVAPPAIPGGRPASTGGLTAPSRRVVRRLAALFAVDAFGGGLVVQSFLVFWLQRRFGAPLEQMSAVFFAAGILQAGSSIAAGWLGQRLGLLRTMVFTHLPSNLLLALVPFMPNFGLAVLVLLTRFALSQMDVPTRQAFVAAAVAPEERARAAAYTNTARYVGSPAGPLSGSALMQWVALAAPFVAAGTIKIGYDLALYALFRRLAVDEPAAARRG